MWMVLLVRLMSKLKKERHKVLIFSQMQMVKIIDVIKEFCDFYQYKIERLD